MYASLVLRSGESTCRGQWNRSSCWLYDASNCSREGVGRHGEDL